MKLDLFHRIVILSEVEGISVSTGLARKPYCTTTAIEFHSKVAEWYPDRALALARRLENAAKTHR